MIRNFYDNTREEIKEVQAKVFNFDTDMQHMEEEQQT